MDNLRTALYNSLLRYYNMLENVGYAPKRDMNALLVISYIYDLLYTDYSIFLDNESKKVLGNALNCATYTACIPFKDFSFPDTVVADEYDFDEAGKYRIYVGCDIDTDTQLYHDSSIKRF